MIHDLDLSVRFWRAVEKALRTPLAPLVRRAFGNSSIDELWAGFTPTATCLEDVSVSFSGYPARTKFVEAAARLLRLHGVVVITDLLDSAKVAKARQEVDRLTEQIRAECDPGKRHGIVAGMLWQVDGAILNSYGKLARHPAPVVTLRGSNRHDPDFGMIDLFGAEKLAGESSCPAVSSLLGGDEANLVTEIVESLIQVEHRVYNIYRNESVTGTRCLHFDNMVRSHKAFIYLSDVLELSNGPYTYVPGSHARRGALAKSLVINRVNGRTRTDLPELRGKELAITGKQGTVILTCQAGVHGGHPQEPGGSRTVLVTHYTPAED